MSQQTSYTLYHEKGYAGQIADCQPREVESMINEETVAGDMKFGVGVIQGTDDNQILLPSSGTDTILGFTVLTHNQVLEEGASEVSIKENSGVSLLRDGALYVCVEDAVTRGNNVFVRFAPGSETVIGAVRSDADTATAVEVTDWQFAESGLAGEIVKIRKK